MKVMLVEDEALILQGLQAILDWEKLGLTVIHTAINGEEALKCWDREPVDIVVTDIEMPRMGGLELLKQIREKDARVRFIILTGYDEFEYARLAIRLEVENYILKPIDEEELEKALLEAVEHLLAKDRKAVAHIDEKSRLMQFLSGKLSKVEEQDYLSAMHLNVSPRAVCYAAVMKLDMESLGDNRVTDVLGKLREQEGSGIYRILYLPPDSFLILMERREKEAERIREYAATIQNELEISMGIMSFISIGPEFYNFSELPEVYRAAVKLQKYRLIDGDGSCVDVEHIQMRKSQDVAVDNSFLSRLIFQKDKEGALNYLEDLFINNLRDDVSLDDLYQLAVKIALMLQEIKTEYKLTERRELTSLSDILEGIYYAEDISAIKMIFYSEITDIIDHLHNEDSAYTPVVRQILNEVESGYREDMNLKTLAYKYHMNTSYLGQIFQKEVGCSFSQYLSNTKNRIAKDMILNTNMKINDIAKEVGYPDTSYFYRKFKQCYGVSPASLREMKRY